MDTTHYHDWNPEISRVDGTISVGSQLDIFAKREDVESFQVVELAPGKKMVWRRVQTLGMGGARSMVIRPVMPGIVEFEIRDAHTGWLSELWARCHHQRLRQIHKLAGVLKIHAEKLTAAELPRELIDLSASDAQAMEEPASPVWISEPSLPSFAAAISSPTAVAAPSSPLASGDFSEGFCFFESPYSSTNDGLLALIAAIPPRTQEAPEFDSQGLPVTTINIGKPIERGKCANGRRRTSRRANSLVLR